MGLGSLVLAGSRGDVADLLAAADLFVMSSIREGLPVSMLEAMLSALGKGEVTALVMPISEYALAAKGDPALAAGVAVGTTGSVAWAVRKEDQALRAALDLHLANVRKSASWNLLLVKYFGEQAPLVLGRRR